MHAVRECTRGADLLDAGLVADGVHDDDSVAVGHDAGLLARVEGGAGVVAVAARFGGVDLWGSM